MASRGRTSWIHAALVGLTLLSAACHDSEAEGYGEFLAAYGRAICAREQLCCSAEDRAAASSPSRLICSPEWPATARQLALRLFDTKIFRFDPAAAERCLGRVPAAACSELFDPETGRERSCPDVLVGTTPLGGACDDDSVCQTNFCERQRCAKRACDDSSCGPGQLCNAVANRCEPKPAAGAVCSTHAACGKDLACFNGSCSARRPDGAPCMTSRVCAGICASSPESPRATCRAGRCQGP